MNRSISFVVGLLTGLSMSVAVFFIKPQEAEEDLMFEIRILNDAINRIDGDNPASARGNLLWILRDRVNKFQELGHRPKEQVDMIALSESIAKTKDAWKPIRIPENPHLKNSENHNSGQPKAID